VKTGQRPASRPGFLNRARCKETKTLAYPLMLVVPAFGCAMAQLTTNHQMHYCHERLRHFTSKSKSMYQIQ
jgi:hypothetical protein